MEKKYLIAGSVLFIAFVVGLLWLANKDDGTNTNASVDTQLAQYAQELGLDADQFAADYGDESADKKIAADIAAGNAAGLTGTPTIAINGVKVDTPRSSEAFLAAIEASKASEDKEVIGEDDHVKGNPNGSVTVTEYSDFQCPACQQYAPTVRAMLEKSTDVKLVYRHYPLDRIHSNARAAARATEAAGKQGKFWEMHDLLFDRQNKWSNL